MNKQTQLEKQGKRILKFETDSEIEDNLNILTKAWNIKANAVLMKSMKRGLNSYVHDIVSNRLEKTTLKNIETRDLDILDQ